MIKVSIIVPIYNVEKYLSRCLDSLLVQSYQNIEVLCINDGTEDHSQQIVDIYVKDHPHFFKSYIKENGGLSDARNYGLKKAKGDYVMFVDGDDYLKADAVRLMIDRIAETGADVVSCGMEYVYDDGSPSTYLEENFEAASPKEKKKMIFINNSACNKIFKKSLFDDYSFPKGMWYEDLATIPTVLARADMIACVKEPLYKYYQRVNSISHKVNPDERVFDIYKAIAKITGEILSMEEYKDSKYVKRRLRELYIIHGADLTTLRIVQFFYQREEYLRRNIEYLDRYYADWYDDGMVRKMGFKKRVLFFLLKHQQYALVEKLLTRK